MVPEELVSVADRYQGAVRRLDVDAVADTWAESGVLWAPGAPDVRGRPAIRTLLAGSYPHVTVEELVMESREFEYRDGIAVELATYRERIRLQGQEARDLRGRYILIWKRGEDGEWRIDHGMYNYSEGSVRHDEAAEVGEG